MMAVMLSITQPLPAAAAGRHGNVPMMSSSVIAPASAGVLYQRPLPPVTETSLHRELTSSSTSSLYSQHRYHHHCHHDDVSVDAVMCCCCSWTTECAPESSSPWRRISWCCDACSWSWHVWWCSSQQCRSVVLPYIHAVALMRIWLCVIYVFTFLYYVLFFLRLFLNTSPGTRQHRWILSWCTELVLIAVHSELHMVLFLELW